MIAAFAFDRRPPLERVPELKAAWDKMRRLEEILTTAQANRAQKIVQETGVKRGPR